MSHQDRSAELVAKREALEELRSSAGWKYFLAHVAKEWRNEGFRARMGTALASRDHVDPQVVYKTALEVERLIKWPDDEVVKLKGHPDNE